MIARNPNHFHYRFSNFILLCIKIASRKFSAVDSTQIVYIKMNILRPLVNWQLHNVFERTRYPYILFQKYMLQANNYFNVHARIILFCRYLNILICAIVL